MDLADRITRLENELSDLRHDHSETRTQVSQITERVAAFTMVYTKLDQTLDKLERAMESRRQDTNNDLKDVYAKISSVEDSIKKEIANLRTDMASQHQKERDIINSLNKWRWVIVGAVATIGFMAGKLGSLPSIFLGG